MSDYWIIGLSSLGALFTLMAAIGIVRMPDLYLRISVTTKAATLGTGLLLIAAAIYFKEFNISTQVFAIILFILLTAPVGAHMIGRASYFTGVKLWKHSKLDDLKGKYHPKSHELASDTETKKEDEPK